MGATEWKPGTKSLGARLLLAAVIVVMIAIRVHRLDLPLERDEGEYAYGGQLVLAGEFSYETLRTLKLPGMHLVSAAAFALLGESKQALHAALLAASLLGTLSLFLAARKLWSEWFAALAASTVAILGTSQTLLGLAAHAEAFALAAACAGAWLLLVALETRRLGPWIASALIFGAAFLMKQPAILFALLAVVVAAISRRRELGPARIATWLAAFALPYLGVCAWMAASGGFGAFWSSTVTYARSYVSDTTWSQGLELLAQQGADFARWQPGFSLLFVLGVLLAVAPRSGVQRRRLILATLVAGLAAASTGLYFRSHYFVFALAGIALTVTAALEAVASRMGRGAALAAFLAAAGAGLWLERGVLFLEDRTQVSARLYHPNPFAEAERIAEIVSARTSEHETALILGSEPEIPFLARRRSATGFVYMYPLMEVHDLARGMQEQALREIEAADPRILVLVNVSMSWLQKSGSEKLLLEWFARVSREKYRVVAVCDLAEPGRPIWAEGAEAAAYRPASRNYVTIFERRP